MQGAAVVDGDFWGDAVKVAAGGGGLGGGFVFVRWLLNWLTGRHDRRESLIEQKDAALDERWAKYTKKMEDRCEKMEERCQRMEDEVEECHKSKREMEIRVARLEGFDKGMGDRRQEEQKASSYEEVVGRRLKGQG